MNKQICYIFILCLALTFFSGCDSNNKYVHLVQNGTMTVAPNVKIGEAFDKFFANPKWKYFKSDNNLKTVEFNGECTWWKKRVNCTIQFIITSDTSFELGAVAIDGVPMTKSDSAQILKQALTEAPK